MDPHGATADSGACLVQLWKGRPLKPTILNP